VIAKRIAVIAGDGVGKEVIPEGIRVLSAIDPHLDFTQLDWGSDRYERTGAMMPPDALATLARFDAIYLGAIGWPTVPDHVSLWGCLLPIRKTFEQYVNLRPIRLPPGITSPLAGRGPRDIDMIFVRENTEGEYSGTGGRVHVGHPQEVAVEVPVFTRLAIERVARYAYVLWDEVVEEVARDFDGVELQRIHVDAMAARMVLRPDSIDVVVASNLFGDILTDLGGALQGSLGLCASANLNPERRYPSMFEPVHGSAPDIAGKGTANPLGAIWCAALMVRHLGDEQGAQRIERAIDRICEEGSVLTADLGGAASTREVGDRMVELVRQTTVPR